MADIKNLPQDLRGLPSIPCNGSRYFYKEGENGEKLLVAQLFGKSHFIIRYPEGSTIDVIPESAVGSKEIEDDSVQMQDLNQSVRDSMITKEDRVTTEELDNFDV